MTSSFDLTQAHRYFSAGCFNQIWTYLEAPERSAAELEEMRTLAHTSFWHWQQRADCTDRNRSIGYWMLSRVYAVAGRGTDATEYAAQARKFAENDAPFYLGYAFEALARAALVNGDGASAAPNLRRARELLALVEDEKDRQLLATDLEELARRASGPACR